MVPSAESPTRPQRLWPVFLPLAAALLPGLLVCALISLPHHLVGPRTLPSRNGALFFSLLGTVLAAVWAFWERRGAPRRG